MNLINKILSFQWLIDLFKVNDDFEKGKDSSFVKLESPKNKSESPTKKQVYDRWQTAGFIDEGAPKTQKILTYSNFANSESTKQGLGTGDLLKLDYSNGHEVIYNLLNEKFYVDGELTVLDLQDVMGMSKAGISIIDGFPIIKINLKYEDPLILKANLQTKQFEFIARLDDYMKIRDGDGIFKI